MYRTSENCLWEFDFREVYFNNNAKSNDLACSTPLAVGAGYDCFDYHPICRRLDKTEILSCLKTNGNNVIE